MNINDIWTGSLFACIRKIALDWVGYFFLNLHCIVNTHVDGYCNLRRTAQKNDRFVVINGMQRKR